MPSISAPDIAQRYLPSRYHYWYARSKIASDPLYVDVQRILAGTQAPLLDVGCGIGLLLHALRATDVSIDYRGVDIDAQKIAIARGAAEAGKLAAVRFEVCDLTREFPSHAGSVALLDVVQYLDARSRDELLDSAARSIAGDARLVIRAGVDDGSWRARFTRMTDRAGHAVRWMKTPPKSQPTRVDLSELLARHGFHTEFRPAWGGTPFNNWLVIASRGASGPGSKAAGIPQSGRR
ncbi:class I SAM-dependent methyltransferase [Povalibacter sp.]|uniref:class I SAM-dependent methyltransferase n=1 Tax=Povalibacter sp. TaxID=1962978 RepID=UPI002F3EBBD1